MTKTEKAALENPRLNKSGKLETKALPRGATEVVATVKLEDQDKAITCLSAAQIDAKAVPEGKLIDIVVKQADSEKAGKALLMDSQEKQYEIHAGSNAEIKPNF